MYSHCIFCQSTLGTNDHIAHFPIGRRLAFDSAKGRLWVVCARCAQWNLAPLEERWEAVEECEREFGRVRARVSTAEIGLARLPDGMDLIRVGAPLRPEFAAWRYGSRFGARRRNFILRTVGASAALAGAGVTIAGIAGSVILPLLGPGLIVSGAVTAATGLARTSPFSFTRPVRIFADDGTIIELGRQLTFDIEMRAHAGPGGMQLAMGTMEEVGTRFAPRQEAHYVTISGREAARAARLLMPRINGGGASPRAVQGAVTVIEQAGTPERFIPRALELVRKAGQTYSPIRAYPTAIRLAIEMVLHEEAERRAMEGELAELEAAWREAERVAGIADNLTLAPHVTAFLDKHRKG